MKYELNMLCSLIEYDIIIILFILICNIIGVDEISVL
jgi:hypothetical protein